MIGHGWIPATIAAAALATGGCTGMDMSHGSLPLAGPMIVPEPRGDLPAPATAADGDPEAEVVAVQLRAAPTQLAYLPGKPTSVWAFNGSVPGPTIEARVGDRVRVHFTNDLPEPTTIHWHGLRVPNDMDGAGRMTQPIPPGGSFDYEFVVPDAGLFWYHPHVRSDVQVERGLYGAILVRDPAEPAMGATIERVLVLDDVRVDPVTGQVDDRMGMRDEMMGREGNLVLVNGAPSNGAIPVARGERMRLRVVNAANARFFKLRVANGTVTQIGSDGGLLRAPRVVDTVQLVPGERADLLVEVQARATLTALPYERARGAGATAEIDLVSFVATDAPAMTPPPLPAALRAIDAMDVPSKKQSVKLGERMAHPSWQFTINDRVFPNVPLMSASMGGLQVWSVRNDTDMDHPFHLHGFFFQKRGVPEWKDTIDIPARTTVDLVIDFATRPGAVGEWLYHCHILEHAEGGMMGEVRVQ